MSRAIVVVLDGFGVGEMADVKGTRPQDIGANTAYKLLQKFSDKNLPVLAGLGLNTIIGCEDSVITKNPLANIGTISLKHEGCDTFAGHQELMGSKPKSPLIKPFQQSIDAIEAALIAHDYQVERICREKKSLLWVNRCVTVGDNLEASYGQVYNVAANLNEISFDEVQQIGAIVRQHNDVGRNIIFGGQLTSSQQLLDAIEVNGECIGTNAPKSGVYDNGFQVVHLGYGVNFLVQVPTMLSQVNVPTTLIGKVADIVHNNYGTSYKKLVDTDKILTLTADLLSKYAHGFYCINVQETDLSGHQENAQRYWNTLERADKGLGIILNQMRDDDLLIVTADHGNDPFIGHGQHTREYVPLMVYREGIAARQLGNKATLADIGATICDFFNANSPEFGHSFLSEIS